MTLTARWPRLPRPFQILIAVAAVAAMVLNLTAVALIGLTVLGVWFCAGARFQLIGGGFRPLRTIDLLDFSAADQLDAWDQEQAMQRARQS